MATRKWERHTEKDDITNSESHALPRLAPLCLAWGALLPHSLSSALPLSLHPTQPLSIIHPDVHQSVIHLSASVKPPPAAPTQNSWVAPCSQRSSTATSIASHHLFSSCWNPPLLLHKETLALLQCSIRRCCATALKIPQGQWGGKLKTELLRVIQMERTREAKSWVAACPSPEGESTVLSSHFIYNVSVGLGAADDQFWQRKSLSYLSSHSHLQGQLINKLPVLWNRHGSIRRQRDKER